MSPDFFSIYHTSMPYWGIFPFQLRVIDLHGATWSLPLTGCTVRQGTVRYFIMIPQWSLFWAIQSGPYFSAFVCHHASYSWRHFLDFWVRFGLRRSHIWWWMISCHPISDLPYIWCHIGTYFVSDEIYGSSWNRTIISTYGYTPRDDLFVILSWSSSGALLEPFSQARLFRHSDVVILPLLRYALLICESDSIMDVDD